MEDEFECLIQNLIGSLSFSCLIFLLFCSLSEMSQPEPLAEEVAPAVPPVKAEKGKGKKKKGMSLYILEVGWDWVEAVSGRVTDEFWNNLDP